MTARLAGIALLLLSGCCCCVDSQIDHGVARARHSWSAQQAWNARQALFAGEPDECSFKDGFKAGYRFACGGYDRCDPPRPKHYWRIAGRTQLDCDHEASWSAGFSHGSLAAQEDGRAGRSQFDRQVIAAAPDVEDVNYLTEPAAVGPTRIGTLHSAMAQQRLAAQGPPIVRALPRHDWQIPIQ